MGQVLVFPQSLIHDGGLVCEGATSAAPCEQDTLLTDLGDEKIILRTELMYRRVRSAIDRSPEYLKASEDLKRITEAYKASSKATNAGTC